jgi:hypothetical protein
MNIPFQKRHGYCLQYYSLHMTLPCTSPASTVTARKDDAPAADQAAITNLVDLASFSGGGGLIQTTSG